MLTKLNLYIRLVEQQCFWSQSLALVWNITSSCFTSIRLFYDSNFYFTTFRVDLQGEVREMHPLVILSTHFRLLQFLFIALHCVQSQNRNDGTVSLRFALRALQCLKKTIYHIYYWGNPRQIRILYFTQRSTSSSSELIFFPIQWLH